MIEVTEYEISTGRILLVRGFPDQETLNLNLVDGHNFIEGYFNGGEMYFVDDQPVSRPTFTPIATKTLIEANGTDVLTITDLPTGECEIHLWGPASDSWAQDGDIKLTVNMPGAYTIRISQWPYQDAEVTFNAT